jgi:dTDP-4-dehydrorhamnose reductase
MSDMGSRWLVVGAAGMLGRDLVGRLDDAGADVLGLDRQALDVTDAAAVRATLAGCRPDVVVNCAAWTAVDDAESREAEALRVNGEAAAHLAMASAESGAIMLQVSTDYVFAGDAETPYAEDDRPDPRTAYGRTKLAGERAVRDALPYHGYVVRTAWLYGAGGANFVRTMIRLERSKDTLDVVDDQRGQPTWTSDLAGQLIALGRAAVAGRAPAGIYHGTSSGDGTWFDLARETFRLLGADPARVRPTTSDAYVRPAPRPAYSVLGHGRWRDAGIAPIRDWRDGLAAAFDSLVAAERQPAG